MTATVTVQISKDLSRIISEEARRQGRKFQVVAGEYLLIGHKYSKSIMGMAAR